MCINTTGTKQKNQSKQVRIFMRKCFKKDFEIVVLISSCALRIKNTKTHPKKGVKALQNSK